MATGSVVLPAPAWMPPDGSSNNNAPGAARLKGSQTNAIHAIIWAFDGAGGLEQLYCSFVLPANYSSGGSLIVLCTVNSTTSANIKWQAAVSAITASDADTPLEHAFSSAASATVAVNTTEARRLISGTITLNMDSAAAGDLITIRLFRDSADAADTSTADAEFWAAEFQYTAA